MPSNNNSQLPHLLLRNTLTREPYTYPGRPRRTFLLQTRDRKLHGNKLKEQLRLIEKQAVELPGQRSALGVRSDLGLCIQFESDPGYPLQLESLEDQRSGIELLATKQEGDEEKTTYATVYVPEGKLTHFFKIVDSYLKKTTPKSEKPKHQTLVDNIAEIKLASLKAFWVEEGNFDDITLSDPIWWEVWLRAGENQEEKNEILNLFRAQANAHDIALTENNLFFPERTVLLAFASKQQFLESILLLNCLAELRRARFTAEVFVRLARSQQHEWIERFKSRLVSPNDAAPAICILDTGINNGHPLIEPGLALSDMHTYNPSWGVADHHGHGTEMAGLSLYGDLSEALNSKESIQLQHRLESCKILPPSAANPPELYGEITKESIARVEISAPFRNRAISLAITTTEFRDRGQPSSWSAAIDQLCSGADDDKQRLLLISAGNIGFDVAKHYPEANQTEAIHDPGQSWNAITVGAYTEKDQIDHLLYPGWALLAAKGGLCPASSTSLIWQKQWPFKPDIVLEGGNMAREPATKSTDYVDSLQLLSTYYQPEINYFTITGDTSAATALAARMAAMIQALYPNFWPETIRGLLIHSASWTTEMLGGLDLRHPRKNEIKNLLRTYGFGVPDLNRARWSASNVLTLIIQNSLQPYVQQGSEIKTNEMHLHELPWPREVLMDLGEVEVEMRVTLSYFIEPSPARRGWNKKFRYASHGLRFDTKSATETTKEFRQRINKVAREEDIHDESTSSDSSEWLLGFKLRSRGSIHSDVWRGTAADLAEKGYLAIFPVNGWWRERKHLGKWNRLTRYSLIVTIKTPSEDIYTPIANLVLV